MSEESDHSAPEPKVDYRPALKILGAFIGIAVVFHVLGLVFDEQPTTNSGFWFVIGIGVGAAGYRQLLEGRKHDRKRDREEREYERKREQVYQKFLKRESERGD